VSEGFVDWLRAEVARQRVVSVEVVGDTLMVTVGVRPDRTLELGGAKQGAPWPRMQGRPWGPHA
jgi:hypothetical protein